MRGLGALPQTPEFIWQDEVELMGRRFFAVSGRVAGTFFATFA